MRNSRSPKRRDVPPLAEQSELVVGAQSDPSQVAPANFAPIDEYPEWLLSQRGSVGQDIDLEF